MKKSTSLVLVFCGLLSSQGLVAQNLPAFPGAEGWGRYATGGRYGSVYHVTNLNDSGTGSFRDAVSQPGRIVVFDVAGVINVSSRITFARNLYVAGQTAPGEGVTLYGDGVSFSGANNLICRYLRVRMGHGGTKDKDCAGVANGTNMIFDHCSFAWGLDETFSINSDGKGDLGNITIQNCVIGQGLMPHSAGGLIQADNITLYRNFYCDNSTRNNKVKGRNQFVNCIVYNWKDGAYIMGDSDGQSYCNIQGNVFVNGPSGSGAAFTRGNGNFHFYAEDNWQDSNKDGSFTPSAVTDYSASDRQGRAYDYPALPVTSGRDLLTELLPTVGASLPYRDMTDCYMVDEVLSYGKRGELIANEGTLPYGIPSSWNVFKGSGRKDSDRDGMPDWWESANGTNPQKDDAMVIAANGYANIENYINCLCQEHSEAFLRQPMMLALASSTTTTLTLSWADYTTGEEGFVVEMQQTDGSWAEVARTKSNTTTAKLTGLTPGSAYTLRVKAYGMRDGEALSSEYSTAITVKTRPENVGILDLDTFVPDYTWTPEVASWQEGVSGWKEGKAWTNESPNSVLIETDENVSIPLTMPVSPAEIVVRGKGSVSLVSDANGYLTGTASLNKDDEGKLELSGPNSYLGATVLHDGILSFNTLEDGGKPSAIGASQEFAQNWIFDGGTYQYTGASTATNRSARILRPTTFAVSRSSAYVTMNGSFEGASDLILDGKGWLQVPSVNFFKYSGSTVLRGGTLYLSTIEASKGGIGQSKGIVMAGGTLKTKGENEAYETYSFPISVEAGTTSVFAPHRNCYMSNTVTGTGCLQIDIPYVREFIKGNWTGFKGRLVANALAAGNLFLAEKSFNMPSAVVVLKNGARACNWDTNGDATLGGLAGDASSQLCGSSKQQNGFNCTWHIGAASTNEVFAGVINDYSCSGSGHVGTVNIEKTGKGYWRLTGTNSYSGTTTVTAGRLIVNGTHTGTGAYSVASGAILSGQGTINSAITVKRGGILMAGDSLISSKKLILNGKVTMQSGSILRVMVRTSATSTNISTNYLDVKEIALGTGATLELDLEKAIDPFANDKTIRVFTSTSGVTGKFAKIVPERPSETQVWDATDLYTKGVLYVRDDPQADGIKDAAQSSASVSGIYDMGGMRHNTVQNGINIVRKEDGSTQKVLKRKVR